MIPRRNRASPRLECSSGISGARGAVGPELVKALDFCGSLPLLRSDQLPARIPS